MNFTALWIALGILALMIAAKAWMSYPYWRWKRMAKKAIRENRIATCRACGDPIIPGDFIGKAIEENGASTLFHAGFHPTLQQRNACCETGVLGIGYWNGERVVGTGNSLADQCLREKVALSKAC